MPARAGSAATAPHRTSFHPISVSGGVLPNALNAPKKARAAKAVARRPKKPTTHPTGVGVFGNLVYIIPSSEILAHHFVYFYVGFLSEKVHAYSFCWGDSVEGRWSASSCMLPARLWTKSSFSCPCSISRSPDPHGTPLESYTSML